MERYEVKYEIGNTNNDETVYSFEVGASSEEDAKNRFLDSVFRDKKLQDKLLFIVSVNKIITEDGVTQTSGIASSISLFGSKGKDVDDTYKELLSIEDYE